MTTICSVRDKDMKPIRSMREFEERYFPEELKRRELDEIMADPRRFGRWLAQQHLDRLREVLAVMG